MMELLGKKIIIVGTGKSGVGAAWLADKAGAKVVIYDENPSLSIEEVEKRLDGKAQGAKIITGALSDEEVCSADLAVISPGVPIDSEIVRRFESHGKPVWGEIELAYNFEKGTVAAITGTNGKTTTTSLVGDIVKAWNRKTFVVGNIGNPYTEAVPDTEDDTYTVAEISSFQLETTHDFKPMVSAILNITPDHLNRHYTMDNYAAVKERIALKQTRSEFCVLNYDDEVLREFGNHVSASPVYFSRLHILENGAYMEGTMIKFAWMGEVTDIIDVRNMHLIGAHNHENVMAATAICMCLGVPADIIADTIKDFKAVEHRIEYVRTLDGVVYYNDSKGTNPDSTIKAVAAMNGSTILIAGGYDKHVEFDELVAAFKDTVVELVLIGATKNQIADAARKAGFTNIKMADSLKEAVDAARADAEPGYNVLLSPACASWDMFSGYEERGRLFKQYVNEL